MFAATAAFRRSGRRMRVTVAPPTTFNRACYWWQNSIQLRTLVSATLASATGQLRKSRSLSDASEMGVTFDRELPAGRAEVL
jgi:hypothetical protein